MMIGSFSVVLEVGLRFMRYYFYWWGMFYFGRVWLELEMNFCQKVYPFRNKFILFNFVHFRFCQRRKKLIFAALPFKGSGYSPLAQLVRASDC